MPIIIGENNQVSMVDVTGQQQTLNTKIYSPKFFNQTVLTGKGGQSKGLLNESRDPKMYKNGYKTMVNPHLEPANYYNKDVKMYDIPCYMIYPDLWDLIGEFKRPNTVTMTEIATRGNETVYLAMPLHAVQIEETHTPGPAGSSVTVMHRDLSACMHMFLFSVHDPSNEVHKQAMDMNSFMTAKGNVFYRDLVTNIFTTLVHVESDLVKAGYTVSRDVLNDFVQDYSLYTEFCKAAERWLTQADYFIADVLIDNIVRNTSGNVDAQVWHGDRFSVFETLSRLEKYSVPLDQYQSIYAKMQTNVPADILADICKSNLNLRLSNTLQHMNNNRHLLQFCPCVNHIQTKIPYSKEQRDAIESPSPLTLVQSGAGTGKSTVILGRIDHMIANGVNPNDITVLSFTNAAANHITDLKPTIHSMTIATMLHTIYSNNFPTHQLSSLATIINSLDIYMNPNIRPMTQQQEAFVEEFKYVLMRLQSHNEYTRANNFVEDHLQDVIDTLDIIEQTSLELESIICYQKMDTLVEPPETQTKHLIIDEVQDNSIAEFIYSIKYTDKHQCSLYIVGDCSQTLYEFRASNPKALNVLEGSGVFQTYKLQTNYRSNQEILDFANVLLGNIEANQYANIQLKANSLKPVTLQSFKDAVTVQYTKTPNSSPQTKEALWNHSIAIDTQAYIKDKLAKGEQVCILAQARVTLGHIQEHLEKTYPGKNIVSLIPQRQYDNALFTKFIANYWNSVLYTPPMSILDTLEREIVNKAPYLTYKKGTNLQKITSIAQSMVLDFRQQYGSVIANWQHQVDMSVMTTQQMLDEIKKLMISYEIRKNNVAQAMMSNRNAEKRKAEDVENADFIISTIHSAKGLEFDNVIVYYENESESSIDEATKRMYYVAFTRARKTEYIFAYGTLARPKIQGDYDKIINDLTAKAAGVATDPDDDTASSDGNDSTDTPAESTTPIAIIKTPFAAATMSDSSDTDEDDQLPTAVSEE